MKNYRNLKHPIALIKWSAVVCFLLMGTISKSQTHATRGIHDAIQIQTNAIFDSLVAVRHHLHRHPELSTKEKETSAYIEQYLLDLGLEVHSGIGGHGVVGILKGANPGKKIAWRADIDALPIQENNNLDFASVNEGVSHQCGHDVHTTIALGMAQVLTSQKEQINGSIYFIFQPSEENFMGAKAMLKDGLMDLISPEECYAAHISPMPTGTIASKPNYLYADYKQINVTFKSSDENEEIIAYTKELISGIQNIEPDSKFWDIRNLMDPNIGIGNPNTIFKNFITTEKQFNVKEKEGKLIISEIVSASNSELIQPLPSQLQRLISDSPFADQLIDISYGSEQISISNDRGNIDNHPALTRQAIQSIANIYGPMSAIPLYGVIPDNRGDDFAYMQREVPGTYFLMGGSNFEKGIIAMPHSPNFRVDEECIRMGVQYFSSLMVERLKDENNTPKP
ncbi:M20 metallopeptidase family protein [Reichenbachiella ulvae]|uniref:Amidohydrolase n=1 Tax=Reichenbachiella ulvae TaxID=2980104 RepID=A0ABT3D047_9BACT|nr:amidohydrolase [Reichenbachiella ulvae]MCV9389168.1 amidohydrolase [Reichenbachiella ulvae]